MNSGAARVAEFTYLAGALGFVSVSSTGGGTALYFQCAAPAQEAPRVTGPPLLTLSPPLLTWPASFSHSNESAPTPAPLPTVKAAAAKLPHAGSLPGPTQKQHIRRGSDKSQTVVGHTPKTRLLPGPVQEQHAR